MTTIYFGTNRQLLPGNDFGPRFSEEGLDNLRFGRAEVQGENFNQYEIQVAPENLAAREPVLGSVQVFSQVQAEMQAAAEDTILFIHGFNTSFREALTAAAQLHHKITTPKNAAEPRLRLNMCLFSWPSDGETILSGANAQSRIAYHNDRLDARASGAAFARGFLKLADFIHGGTQRCPRRIHLLAHSMGNYVLRYALQDLRSFRGDRLPRLFDQMILMAADEDDDAFESDDKLGLLTQLTRRTSVYFNREDLALWASDRIKGNPPRLGSDGPLHPQTLPRNVYPIDCTDVVSRLSEPSEHSYHIRVERVLQDLRQVLAGNIPDEIRGRKFVAETNRYRLLMNANQLQIR
ncbi:alpha/beta hydrolase [Lyngbya confervoides]|uniref:Alpha/beta hydrolase n=1 Tax=Lyngbya confervoides BDU141951 TaxID=1574623 RepID=A0ABD4T961_9CYAN|nr:alpha/beta hydrolase [Lyngbya confervoides]MCM1984805.1 alpha/beta hydrolase [Lyngbya confervoides BDU141951]